VRRFEGASNIIVGETVNVKSFVVESLHGHQS
jgi:hypothetical protein